MLRIHRAAPRAARGHVRVAEFALSNLADDSADAIIREFQDPYLEVVRLVREATEIEHALMVQYLYAGFSIRSAYAELFGQAISSADSILGVAIQEMEHLHAVNQLLVALKSAPNLIRQDFPYEPEIYPFPLNLEPLTRTSVAKYVYTEAPRDAIDPNNPNHSPEDKEFVRQLYIELGTTVPNRLGSLYAAIIAAIGELKALDPMALPDADAWVARLEAVKSEGEVAHFTFFKSVFMATHPTLADAGGLDVWKKPPSDAAYPSIPLPVNPSALRGHPNQIPDETNRAIATLSNLHYWIVLILLDLHYRSTNVTSKPRYMSLSKVHMRSPLFRLGIHLALLGGQKPESATAIPFDTLNVGYAPGVDLAGSVAFVIRFLQEAEFVTTKVRDQLPPTFPFSVVASSIAALRQIQQSGAY